MNRKYVARPGERYGRGVVVSEYREGSHWRAVLMCDCGAEYRTRVDLLVHGRTKSCGCLHRDHAKELGTKYGRENAKAGGFQETHGLARHPLYHTWNNMTRRCHLPTHTNYANYGGRGIQVFEEWRDTPEAFLRYCDEILGPKPEGYSLDRIDNNGNYEPGNLRWADAKTQVANRRPRVK